MDKNIEEKLKLIDIEISNALNTISELEKDLKDIRADEMGNIPENQCHSIKDKFASFNKSFNLMLEMLVDSGVLTEQDIEK